MSRGHRAALQVAALGLLVLALAIAETVLWGGLLFIVIGIVAAAGAATTAAILWHAGNDPTRPAGRP